MQLLFPQIQYHKVRISAFNRKVEISRCHQRNLYNIKKWDNLIIFFFFFISSLLYEFNFRWEIWHNSRSKSTSWEIPHWYKGPLGLSKPSSGSFHPLWWYKTGIRYNQGRKIIENQWLCNYEQGPRLSWNIKEFHLWFGLKRIERDRD